MRKLFKSLIFCLAVITAQEACADALEWNLKISDSKTYIVNSNLKPRNAMINIGESCLFPGLQFYFVNAEWIKVLSVDFSKMKMSEENGKRIGRFSDNVKGLGKYDLSISMDKKTFSFSFEYDIPAESKVKYCVASIFLSKSLFRNALLKKFNKTEKDKISMVIARKLNVGTELGSFEFDFKTSCSIGKISQWILRDDSHVSYKRKRLAHYAYL